MEMPPKPKSSTEAKSYSSGRKSVSVSKSSEKIYRVPGGSCQAPLNGMDRLLCFSEWIGPTVRYPAGVGLNSTAVQLRKGHQGR